jgi:fatty acid desaturase
MVDKKTIIIENQGYDITNFKHPGGNVINFMTEGQDATIAFQEFHYRSKTAQHILRSLPKVEINKPDEPDKEMLEDFNKFRKSLEIRGFFTPDYLHVSFRILEVISIYLLAAYYIQHNIAISILLFGLCGGRCGWLQHEGGHNSLTGLKNIDKQIQNVSIGFFVFGDSSMWNKMHNKHHATPQKIGNDVDLDTAPLVIFNKSILDSNFLGPLTKLWLKYQAYSFLPITSGLLVMPFWTFYLHPRKIIYDQNFTQGFLVISGHTIRIFLFSQLAQVSFFYAMFYHFAAIWVTGIYLFGHFSLSHSFTPTVDKNDNPNWVRFAIEHTVDISPNNRLVSWIMGYLNNQVIHHLFPSMPQYKGPEVSKELILFCKKWDIKYNIMTYFDAWHRMLENLDTVGNELL